MIESVLKLKHKNNYETPWRIFNYIKERYKVNPLLDVCATPQNAKCPMFFTEQDDTITCEYTFDFFMNPIYNPKGWRTINKGKPDEQRIFYKYGIADFIRHADEQRRKHNVTGTLLVFANISGTSYFQKHVGETEADRQTTKCEINFLPKRVNFTLDGKPQGTPAFTSMAIVMRPFV